MAVALVALLSFSIAANAQISVSPLNKTVDAAAGSNSFAVTVPGIIPWSVVKEGSPNDPAAEWITITSFLNNNGSQTVTFDYTENKGTLPRTNRFRVTRTDTQETAFFEFIQEPPEQTAILDPDTIVIDGNGGTRDIAVTVAPVNTPWTAVTQANWIQIVSQPAAGAGTLRIRILANTTGVQRVGDVFVLNNRIRVTQDFVVATFTLVPTSANIPAAGGNGSVAVSVSAGNPQWTAVSNDAWITVTGGAASTGNGTVMYSVAANASNDSRQGTITIAGQTFTVTQAGADDEPPPAADSLTVSLSALTFTRQPGGSSTLNRNLTVNSTGDPLNFTVSITGGSWLRVDAASGTTPKTLQFTADAAGLATGSYSATVTIKQNGSSDQEVVPATLTVLAPPSDLPRLSTSARSLYFSRVFGGELPGAQRIRLSPPGVAIGATASFQPNTWLNATVVNEPGGTFLVASIRNFNLLVGNYDSVITIKSNSFQFADLDIPVRYNVILGGGPGPQISSGGVVNGATFGGGASPNTWISIFGSGLASSTQNWSPVTINGALLPTSLAGAEVYIAGIRAAISYASPTQLNALVPAIVDRGWVEVVVRLNNVPSEPAYLWLGDRSPTFFVYTPGGGKYPAAQHGDAAPVGPPGLFPGGAVSRPAMSLEQIAIYGSGFGETVPAADPSRFFRGANPLAAADKVKVTLGGLDCKVEFVGLVAPGLYQLNISLPSLSTGEYDLIATIDGVPTQVGLVIVVGQ